MADAYKNIISVNDINNGAVADLFGEEWKKLLKNIADENTKATVMRKITINVSVKPNSEERGSAEVMVDVNSRLAPLKPSCSMVFLENSGSTIEAFTKEPEVQDELKFDNVTNISEAK